MNDNEKLIGEDLEITAVTTRAAPVQLPDKVISIFPAFKHRNFQLYFIGQFFSTIGFWLHLVGLGYYIFQLTNSAFWVGMSVSSLGIPILLFSTIAGVFVEKVNKRKLLIVTQFLSAIFAITLGILVFQGLANLTLIIIFSLIIGLIGAVDLPTRLSFIVEMVGKKDLASAVPIGNAVFNASRFVGPALAGVLIATFGVGWVFIIYGISALPAIVALSLIKPLAINKDKSNTHPFESLKIGIKYSFTHPKILNYMIIATMVALFLWPYQTLMPVIAERVFASGPQGLGTLLSAAGLGSLTGAIITSSQARRKNKSFLIIAGLLTATISLIIFSFTKSFIFAHIILFFSGLGMITLISTINTLIQLASPDHMRARIIGVYLTMFVGMMPFGNALAGIIAEKTSSQFTIGIGASIVLVISIVLYYKGAFSNLN